MGSLGTPVWPFSRQPNGGQGTNDQGRSYEKEKVK
jgi:hypothetical protein